MREENDWRLMNQEAYLKNAPLLFTKYTPYSDKWDHDHCAFCGAAFSEGAEDLKEGYCTPDRYHWICKTCFEDFEDMFHWTVTEENTP